MALFFAFVDGIGVGENGDRNPLADDAWSCFSAFTGCKGIHSGCADVTEDRTLYKPIDANLGVKGLPQSGTGQVSLFTGKNASKMAGRHFGPFPHSKTRDAIEKESLFHSVLKMGKQPHFLNAYPDIFFKKAEEKDRWSCTTLMAKSAGVRLNTLEDIRERRAVTAEIIQKAWRERLHLDVPNIKPEDASERVLNALQQFDLVLYEYYLTDKAGHEQDPVKANRVLTILNRFLTAVLDGMKPEDTFLLTSDHGNLEDLSVKTHTRNPVPLLVSGNTAPFLNAKSILDVTPGILRVLEEG